MVNFNGGDTWVPSLRCLAPQGRLLTCGATSGFDSKTDLRYIWSFEHNILGANAWTPDDLKTVLSMVESGDVVTAIDRVHPLDQIVEAERRLEGREVFGNVIVTPQTSI